MVSAFSGPIPPPAVLMGYKDVDPSLPDVIVRRWGAEQDHRHMQEAKILEAQITLAATGQKYGAILGTGALVAATLIGVYGGAVAGPVAATAIVSIVGAVLGGTYLVKRVRSQHADHQEDDER